jgi:hypothetical protein
MYRVRLNDAQYQELNRRAYEIGVKPQIAVHLGVYEKRVRHWIKGSGRR